MSEWYIVRYRPMNGRRTKELYTTSESAALTVARQMANKHHVTADISHDGRHVAYVEPSAENPLSTNDMIGLGVAIVGGGILGYLFYQNQVAAQALGTQNAQFQAQIASDQTQLGNALAGSSGNQGNASGLTAGNNAGGSAGSSVSGG